MAPRKGPADPLNAKKETLAAVVLADSFAQVLRALQVAGEVVQSWPIMPNCLTAMQQFRPITVERAKVLLPVVNVPMIDYTLEWLVAGGVEEVCLLNLFAWCMRLNVISVYASSDSSESLCMSITLCFGCVARSQNVQENPGKATIWCFDALSRPTHLELTIIQSLLSRHVQGI